MGPFYGQLFVGDQGQSKLMRVYLEKIKEVYQGMVWPFKEGFSSGILRMNWGSDGSMFVGMTSRGWSSTGGGLYGLQRLEWNGKVPFEMKTVQAKVDGFEIEFTEPVDESSVKNPSSWALSSFTYQYHHEYGSPVINLGSCPIKAIEISEDGLKVRLVLDSMRLGYIHEIKAEGVRSSTHYALLHNYGYYTLNNFPDGEKLVINADNKVAIPSTMEHQHMMMETEKNKLTENKIKTSNLKPTIKHQTQQPTSWTKGPDQVIEMGTKPGLKFDQEVLNVKSGSKVKLIFKNNDDMLHNLVITLPGRADKVGKQAVEMGLNAEKFNFIPNTTDILFHTLLLHPKESDAIYFVAPEKAGNYVYICSYPGHYLVMRGILKVY